MHGWPHRRGESQGWGSSKVGVRCPSRRPCAGIKVARVPVPPLTISSAPFFNWVIRLFPFQVSVYGSCLYLLGSSNSLLSCVATVFSKSVFAFHSVCGTLLAFRVSHSSWTNLLLCSLLSVHVLPRVRDHLLHQYPKRTLSVFL